MPEFSETQKRISLLLMQGPKTAEELAGLMHLPYGTLMEDLKEMLKLNVVTKDGYPTKYALKKEIVQTVQHRKSIEEKDPFKTRLNCIIEVQAIEEELLKKTLKEIEEMLRNDSAFTIYGIKTAEILKNEGGEYYSSFLEANLTAKDFKAIVHLMFYYAPISIEVVKPEKIELWANDLQDALVDMSELIHAYADQITKLMNRKELEEFNRSLFASKKPLEK